MQVWKYAHSSAHDIEVKGEVNKSMGMTRRQVPSTGYDTTPTNYQEHFLRNLTRSVIFPSGQGVRKSQSAKAGKLSWRRMKGWMNEISTKVSMFLQWREAHILTSHWLFSLLVRHHWPHSPMTFSRGNIRYLLRYLLRPKKIIEKNNSIAWS